MTKRLFLLIIWLIVLFLLNKYSIFPEILWGKGLFFAILIPFVFLLKIPFQITVVFGVFVLFFSSILSLHSVSQGERIVIYAWGLLTTALLQRYAQS